MSSDKVGYWGAVAIGIGGMVGGGIFAVLGLAVQLAHGGTPVAFLIAGFVALVTSYSYAKLSVQYPSQGGTVVYLDRAFGTELFTGALNNLLWISYMIMLALYAYAFGNYGATFFPKAYQPIMSHVLISLGIVIPALLNVLSASIVSKAETYVVIIKVAILVFFIAVGFQGVDTTSLSVSHWTPIVQVAAGGMIIFLAYEGFELIANTAQDIVNPESNLPKALYSSIGFVIILYVLIAIVSIGNLAVPKIVQAKDYALAAAAKPFLGHLGFTMISIAAMLSTFSAINATLYGSSRLSYIIAKEGELPKMLENKIWNQPIEGLIITTVLALLLANLGDLSQISTMGSSGFLLIFAAVNASNIKLSKKTDSKRWISIVGLAGCLVAFGALLWYTITNSPGKLWILGGMLVLVFLIEFVYREYRGKAMVFPEEES
ncbi:MAG TPA: APC family permease [Balneolaceae bacterium]|nr:APC family permease [Balneolaceae bacterium]